jgi:D-xylose transport system substrate-binding protein
MPNLIRSFASVLKLTSLSAFAALCAGSSVSLASAAKKIKIGLSLDTLKEERWQKDRDLFLKTAEKLGAEVLVQAANGDAARQQSQAENLLTQGVDVLVVVPYNGVAAAGIVTAAHKRGKKVISYDRLIKNSDVDLYISFDNIEVGRMQAKYITEQVPKGNYVLIGGAPTDNNAKMFREGQMEVLNPLIKSGVIKVISDQWAKDWQANEALKHTENALTKSKNDIQAVVASNDGTAGGVISALKQKKLDGSVKVSGQDADLAGCQRIAEGTQAMTVYKPVALIATAAAEAAVAMAKNEPVKNTNQKVNNGKKDVPSLLLKPQLVTQENMLATVIKDGWQKFDDVYKNVPAEKRPKQ